MDHLTRSCERQCAMTMGTSPFNLTQARYVSLVVQTDGCATTTTSRSATLTHTSRRREKDWCRLLRPDSTSATWTLGSDGLGHVEVRGISHAPEPPISANNRDLKRPSGSPICADMGGISGSVTSPRMPLSSQSRLREPRPSLERIVSPQGSFPRQHRYRGQQ